MSWIDSIQIEKFQIYTSVLALSSLPFQNVPITSQYNSLPHQIDDQMNKLRALIHQILFITYLYLQHSSQIFLVEVKIEVFGYFTFFFDIVQCHGSKNWFNLKI